MLRLRVALALLLVVAVAPWGVRSEEVTLLMYPWPGTQTASPHTQISFRGAGAGAIGDVIVVGATSGVHQGVLKSHSDGEGASFLPDQPFTPGEVVVVQTELPVAGTDGNPTRFTVSVPVEHEPSSSETVDPNAQGWRSYWTVPGMRAPLMTIHTASADRRSGVFLLTQSKGPSGSGPMIVDQMGRLIWFKPLPAGVSATDFRAHRYRERPVLAWWEGALSFGQGFGEHVVLDHAYKELFRVRAGNGYQSDLHDLVLSDDGTATVIIYNWVQWNLAPVGGPAVAPVVDGVIQQIDVGTGLVRYEWHSLDHIAIDESFTTPQPSTTYDYIHLNSVERLPNGDFMLSARHTSAVYVISGESGKVLWRIGGRLSDMEIPSDAHFAYQHDAQLSPDGVLSIFDNGAGPVQERAYSRGLYLQLDFLARKARTIREVVHPERVLASSQGNMQTLSNGHALVGWGSRPFISQHDPDGRLTFLASMSHGNSYRAYRQQWNGRPASGPRFAIHRSGSSVVAYVSWNGDTQTRTWLLMGGTSPRDLRPIASVRRTGFESAIRVVETDATYFAVRALNARGKILRVSPARRG